MMRIVFMGTPEFALPSLSALFSSWEVVGVVTQPDKPRGRHREITPSPVKAWAQQKGLPVYQPGRQKAEFASQIRNFRPEVIVVVAFGKILPDEILSLPQQGCINLHASLLPKYRGAAPIEWAIIRGEEKTGLTTIHMDESLDGGDLILQEEVVIHHSDTAGNLRQRMAPLGADLLVRTLKAVERGTAPRIPQDEKEATYAPLLKSEDGDIHWNAAAKKIHNLVRGLNPKPGAYTKVGKKKLKMWETEVRGSDSGVKENPPSPSPLPPGERELKSKERPGQVVEVEERGMVVATGEGFLLVKTIQKEGGKVISSLDFLRGERIGKGAVLG